MGTCIICKKNKPLTDEHIIPEFLGGSLRFKRVCKQCNDRMGDSFEGRIAKNFFSKSHRYLNNIKGKSGKAPSPFKGSYTDLKTQLRFQVDGDNELSSFPNLNINDGENGVSVELSIDEKELEKAPSIIEEGIIRYLKNKGVYVTREKVSKSVKSIIKTAPKQIKSIRNPTIQQQISIDLEDLFLLYIKIAYELACFHFGDDYMNDSVADELRKCLYNKVISKNIKGQIPIENSPFENYVTNKYHWVIFSGPCCYINILSFPGIVGYVSKKSNCQSIGIVYRFCFKKQTYDSFPLIKIFRPTDCQI